MNTIKPIQTEYNGTLYRSKLEAKWAVYFDLCGAKFEYEPQAFDLGDGVNYLPDFCVKNVLSVHGKFGDQSLDNSEKYEEFWFECKGVMSSYDSVKISRFQHALEQSNEFSFSCPFYVLDKTPKQMFDDFDELNSPFFEFGPIDGDYDFPFVIGKQSMRDGIGLFGKEDNYLCLMDDDSRMFAREVEKMFRWNPS